MAASRVTDMDDVFQDLHRWIGKSVTAEDTVTPTPARALAATLNREMHFAAGDPLPPPWHWQYFLTMEPPVDAGPDGHPRRGGFLPPVPLPRRMWAGSRMEFFRPLRVGDAIRRESRIAGSAKMAPGEHRWLRDITPTPVLLFRYSALTFNSHRIHYDYPYVTGVEGYPGLIVHGPLLATLLIDLVLREMPGVRVTHFQFRAVAPLFDNAAFAVCGRPNGDGKSVALWAKGAGGRLAMDATATIA
jgi:3-methylfumaryl-CoA hydratase